MRLLAGSLLVVLGLGAATAVAATAPKLPTATLNIMRYPQTDVRAPFYVREKRYTLPEWGFARDRNLRIGETHIHPYILRYIGF